MLSKNNLNINFAQGLNTKSDPWQVPAGQFLSLENSIFDKAGLMQKRNGFGSLPSLPDSSNTFLTTFNGNLTAIGTSLEAYSQGSMTWVNKGTIQPMTLDTLPLVRSSTNQSQADSAVSSTGLICTAYTDNVPVGGANTLVYKYVVSDATTGQNIINSTTITSSGATIVSAPRVFIIGTHFLVMFVADVSGTKHLQYIPISISDPTIIGVATDISTQVTLATTGCFDAVAINNRLYIAWNGSDLGGAVRMTFINNTLGQGNTVVFAGRVATLMSISADYTTSSPVIYAFFYDLATTSGYVLAVDQSLLTVLAPTSVISSGTILNVACIAQNSAVSIIYEVSNAYSYGSQKANYLKKNTVSQAGSVGSSSVMARSVGLASKAFLVNSVPYVMAAYSSPYQPTYFMLNLSGNVMAKLAYSNGGGYTTTGLPSSIVDGDTVKIPYLIKDLVQAANKIQGAANPTGVYSQTGVNLASFTIGTSDINTAEIGSDLHLSGGLLWMYDGVKPVEHSFHLWPDNINATWSAAGGSIVAKPDGSTNANAYFYQITYEWADNNGNVFRSAPSVPLAVTTTGAGSSGSITIDIPTLRLTYKTSSPVKIVAYRWSVGQQTYYQVTSLTIPTLNDTTVDSIQIVDTLADASIIGNNIIYTTGGVIENIAAPAIDVMTLFKSRLIALDAEDKNLLWYSKQVIETVPVDMSDLFTIYVAPTIGAQGNTGPIRALSSMDDKLIIFKSNAINYLTGNGPDNTGANNDFSEPVFITSTVGCSNQNSIVFMPDGLMFQSDKGIWLLGRDLSTQYIGAPVEGFTQDATVLSAVNVPGTNQVRFTLDSGVTLMYDYYFRQWGSFSNIPAIASTLYQNLHTFINSRGEAYQETPNTYLDGTKPVLMKFKTSWLNLAGLQGFERAYFFYFLGRYITPHKLGISIAFDYNDSFTQSRTFEPDNYNVPYGGLPLWGSDSPWGGNGNVEQGRVFLDRQKCQAFQITVEELYDPSFGVAAGAGFTMSGLNLVVGAKKSYTATLKPNRSI